jgi:hypothetical protein
VGCIAGLPGEWPVEAINVEVQSLGQEQKEVQFLCVVSLLISPLCWMVFFSILFRGNYKTILEMFIFIMVFIGSINPLAWDCIYKVQDY